MRDLARQGATAPLVRGLALRIVQGIPGRDGEAQAVAIRRWMRDNVLFLRDPAGTELLYTPDRMVRILTGGGPLPILHVDCDDAAVLAAALGGAVGLRSRFVVVGFLSPDSPYRHVWVELRSPSPPDSRWVEMDVTRSAQRIPTAAISRTLIVKVL